MGPPEPTIELGARRNSTLELLCTDATLGPRRLYAQITPEVLFTNNESNNERLYHVPNPKPHVKDAFHEYLIAGRREALSPDPRGTKAGLLYKTTIQPSQSTELRLILTDQTLPTPFSHFE